MKTLLSFLTLSIILLITAPTLMAEEEVAATVLEQPIMISSAGQSADVKLVAMLAKKQKLDYTVVDMATPSDLENVKTLIIVPGFSSKGLGAAGVSQKEEMERVVALVEAAQKKSIPIVTVHIGGNARRGTQSDGFNALAAEASVHMIVVAQGDEDKFFTKIGEEEKIELEVVDKIVYAAKPLGALFAK